MNATNLAGKRVFDFSKLNELMCFIQNERQSEIRDEVVNMLTQIQSQQLIEIKGIHLQKNDLILDLKKKQLYEVDYVSHYDATGLDGDNNTIMVSYIGEDDSDNFNIDANVIILIDKADLLKRKIDNDILKEMFNE